MEYLLIWQIANHSSVSKLRSLVANFNTTELFQLAVRCVDIGRPAEDASQKQSVIETARVSSKCSGEREREKQVKQLNMQHCEWNRGLTMFPPFNSSSFYIDDILNSSSQRPQPVVCSSTMCEAPKPPCISPAFHIPAPRAYTNLSSPFTPYSRGFGGFQAPSIPSVYEAYNDHSKYKMFSELKFSFHGSQTS